MAYSVQMKRSIEEFGVGDRRSSILVLALWPYHRGLLSDSIPAGELRGKEFCGVPNKSHEQEQGQVFLTGGNRELSFFLFLPLSVRISNRPISPPFRLTPPPIFTVNHLIDSYSWAFNCIQLCGSKKTSPSRNAVALHSNRPRTKAK